MICNITKCLEANPGLVFGTHKCVVETWDLHSSYNEYAFAMVNHIDADQQFVLWLQQLRVNRL